ncbi:MAG: endonuclease domain-containing protein [Desulfuromonadaceae bacterium]|nr:endonuclease domain-containing protein [Desulfuromonadaceae bacterium]MDD2856369.1 endonuclease domain-containing protein [Desulfuromonadaceae bacterium]
MIGQNNKSIRNHKLPQTLRNNMTDAERCLWQTLRGRQVDGLKFRRQHPFGDYILDFVCLDKKLVIEVDGGQHDERKEYDCVRTLDLEKAGFTVLRFWNNEVMQELEAVKERIWLEVERLYPIPLPTSPLKGEEIKA